MKEILGLMADYNQTVNKDLFDLLQEQDESLLRASADSFFGNILGLLNHILVSDLGWLTAYRESNLDLPVLESTALDFEHPGFGRDLYDDLGELRAHRQAIDQLFIDLVGSTAESVFQGEIEVSRKEVTHTFPFGKVLMHLFNHQTHHRGAISQILDENNVKNDYSNLLRLLV